MTSKHPVKHRTGKPHSPASAVLLGLVLPGSAQAYNGRLIKGAMVLLLSPLIIPWIWGALSGKKIAQKISDEGGRFGAGGPVSVGLHIWFCINIGLFVLGGLSAAGVFT